MLIGGYIIIGVLISFMLIELVGVLRKRVQASRRTPLEEHLNRVEKAQLLVRLKLERVRQGRLVTAEKNPTRGEVVPIARARRA